MIITLNENELIMAASVGVRRNAVALARKYRNTHGADITKSWLLHCEGACGELAVAKAMNWYWDGSVNTFKLPDVGNVQVKTRSREDYELLIRKGDVGIYVLVIGLAPKYTIHGWFNAINVREEWLQAHGGREKAYFVPQKELYPMNTLVNKIVN